LEQDALSILYEDNHLLAVNKMPSDIVQGDRTGDETLADRVREHLRSVYGKTGNVFGRDPAPPGQADQRRGALCPHRQGT